MLPRSPRGTAMFPPGRSCRRSAMISATRFLLLVAATSYLHSAWGGKDGGLGSCSDELSSATPCTCGVFLDRHLHKNSLRPEHEENSVFSYPIEDQDKLHSGSKGRKICTKKCVEMAMKYMKEGPELLCAAVDGDVHREKAHLFIKNFEDKWFNTKLNSGREFCCKDGISVKC